MITLLNKYMSIDISKGLKASYFIGIEDILTFSATINLFFIKGEIISEISAFNLPI